MSEIQHESAQPHYLIRQLIVQCIADEVSVCNLPFSIPCCCSGTKRREENSAKEMRCEETGEKEKHLTVLWTVFL